MYEKWLIQINLYLTAPIILMRIPSDANTLECWYLQMRLSSDADNFGFKYCVYSHLVLVNIAEIIVNVHHVRIIATHRIWAIMTQ